MGIRLTGGVYATEICSYAFFDVLTRNAITDRSFVKNEEVWEWDLHEVYNQYRQSGSNNWFYYIAKDSQSGNQFGLYFTQQNDIISVYYATGTTPGVSPLFQFNISAPPSNFKVCVLYDYYNTYANSDPILHFSIIKSVQEIVLTSVEILPPNYGGVDAIWGVILHTERNLTDFSVTGPVHVDNRNALVTDENKFGHFTGELPYLRYQTLPTGFLLERSRLRQADGTPAQDADTPEEPPVEPYDPSDPDPYPPKPIPDSSSDQIPIPPNPPIGVTNIGFINVYKPSANDLVGLGEILFPDITAATDIVEAVTILAETIANQNLVNFIIDCHIIPVSPQVGANSNIKVSYRDTGISVPKVTSDYIDATCGSLNIPEYFNGWQDYALTKSRLYLPFVGFVDTKPEFWQAGTISVDYKFNIIDGSFMCYVRSVSSKSNLNGSVIAQYSGNACMHIPITGINYATMVSGLVGSVMGAATSGDAAAVMGGAWSAINTIARGGNIEQSNGYTSSAVMLGVREAFLLIERPVQSFPSNYGHDKGYPSNITVSLASVTGYTEISDIDLSGIPLTDTELSELRDLLKTGVYL